MRGIKLTNVVFPEPVGPTIARLLPCGHAQVHIMQNLFAFVAEVEPSELDLARDLAILRARSVLNIRLFVHDFVDADERRRAALENIDDPAQGDDRPRELHHVGAERNELPNTHRAGERQSGWNCRS